MSGVPVPVVVKLKDRIAAALAIHRPCHQPHPWRSYRDACERTHYEDTEAAECLGCGYDSNDQPTPYPCPTAIALGVPAPEPTQETAP